MKFNNKAEMVVNEEVVAEAQNNYQKLAFRSSERQRMQRIAQSFGLVAYEK